MIYWISTGLISAMLTVSAYTYVLHRPTIEGIGALGFPDFFRVQLALLKVIAIPVLLVPQVPVPMKEWAYAGVALYL